MEKKSAWVRATREDGDLEPWGQEITGRSVRQLCPQPEGSINLLPENPGSIKNFNNKGGFNPWLPLFLAHIFAHQDYQQTLITTDGILQLKLPTSQET